MGNTLREFYEIQRFQNPWIRYSVAGLTIGFILYFVPGAVKQLVYGEPWGNKPVSDTTLIAVGIIVLGIMLALCFFFFNLRLVTLVNSEGLRVRLFPLSKIMIPFGEIVHCKPTTYNAMEEFGGWGVKHGKRGRALTIYGNQAVQLTLKGGEVLLIGSQRPEQLSECISYHLSRLGKRKTSH
ncbi:MAG: hypothetical protein DRH12_11835, partial [Deltaproteobacteria bacterium]